MDPYFSKRFISGKDKRNKRGVPKANMEESEVIRLPHLNGVMAIRQRRLIMWYRSQVLLYHDEIHNTICPILC